MRKFELRGGCGTAKPNRKGAVIRLSLGLFCLSALFGCSGGGLIPGGPHSMDSYELNRIATAAASREHISSSLVLAVIKVESGGDPSAVSSAGAAGLMQLMPDTALMYGVTDRFDPEQNVDGGTHFLRDLLARYHHNTTLALAAYNAGPGAVDGSGGVPPYAETRAYVARVNAALHS